MELTLEQQEKMKRKHKQSIYFNELEFDAFVKYCKKYRVKNKAKFMREAIVTAILKQFDKDYPTLFDVDSKTEQK